MSRFYMTKCIQHVSDQSRACLGLVLTKYTYHIDVWCVFVSYMGNKRDIENVMFPNKDLSDMSSPTRVSTRVHTCDNPVGNEAHVDVGCHRRETHANETH